jgi:hypothetical protein
VRQRTGAARGTGLRRGDVALRSGTEAGVDGRFRPARRGLDFQTTAGDGYSPWGIGTTREEEKENPISLVILQINHWIIL